MKDKITLKGLIGQSCPCARQPVSKDLAYSIGQQVFTEFLLCVRWVGVWRAGRCTDQKWQEDSKFSTVLSYLPGLRPA